MGFRDLISATFRRQMRPLLRGLMLSSIAFAIGCGGGKKSGNTEASGNTILPGAAKLATPSVDSHSNPAFSNSSPLTISGTCEPGATVRLGGDATRNVLCVSGSYTIALASSNNGTYNYTIRQTNLINHPSDELAFRWVRTTTAPPAPTITSPNPNPFRSNGNSISIAGTCSSGATVNLTGDATASVACPSGTFSFNVSQSSDANYTFSIRQTDTAGNTSPAASVSWLRDTVAPSAPTITAPNSNPLTSADGTVTIAGVCETGATVHLAGAASDSTACPAGTFSFEVVQASDGTYSYSLTQADSVGNVSPAQSFQWIRSSAVPATPVLSSPGSSPIYTNQDTLTISGSCEGTNTVELSGSATDSTTCSSSSFSFTVTRTSDATYTFSLIQKSGANVESGSVGQIWVRDTVAPSVPTVTAPATNPHASAATTLAISGACEINADVNLSGDGTGSATCVSGTYSINVSKGSDGTYNFNISQTDRAGNTSSSTTRQWIRDTTAPAPLTRTVPATSPYASSGASVTVGGACETGATVSLGGDSTATMTCSGSAYSFNIPKASDGTYNFTLSQADAVGNTSAQLTFQWIRDTVAPASPVISTPALSLFKSSGDSVTIAGTCEAGTTVNYSGAATGTTTCATGNFTFTNNQGSDGTYNYSLTLTDAAGNTSTAASQQWLRDTTAPSAPTITTPATNPYISNGNSVTIAGGCESGATVSLSGDANLTTSCASGAYSFNVPKSSDAVFSFSVSQADEVGNGSNSVSFQWTRDTTAPAAPTLTSPALNPYTSAGDSVTVSGTCEAGATVNYAGSENGTTACASGSFSFSTSQTVDGTYSYAITQTDLAGNTSLETNFQWYRLSTIPSTPTITMPAVNPLYSNASSVTISGACTSTFLVELLGDETDSMICVSDAYSFSVPRLVDGSYSFSVRQRNASAIWSAAATVTWHRDTIAPNAPTIASPAVNPLTSSANSLTITGSCENNATVLITGGTTGSAVCSSSSYSFSVNQSSDGTFDYSISQRDLALNVSSAVAFQWIRDTSVPAAPTITTPASSPIHTNGGTLAIAGGCTTGLAVVLSGEGTGSTTCASNAYAFNVTKTTDGSYVYSVRQRNAAGTFSSSASVTWNRDTVAPTTPTIASPVGPVTSNADTITISGACESNATVRVSGSATQQTTCTSNSYSIAVTKNTDAVYTFSISQTDLAGNNSGAANLTWTRDTVAPGTPTLTNPLNNPYTSGDTNLSVRGACEPGATVAMTGSSSQNQTCPVGGTYNFAVSASVDNTYNYAIRQTDAAGNASATLDFQWIRNTAIPFTPTITFPAQDPFHSNGSTVTITATCDSSIGPQKAIVFLNGDVTAGEVSSPAGSLEQECTTSPVTWVVSKSVDGAYQFLTSQEDPNNGQASAEDSLTWYRDTVAPAAPTITTPDVTPYTAPNYFTLAGACEDQATVTLAGDSSQTTTCSGDAYSFLISKSVDGTYNFIVGQSDRAGNTSPTVSQQWIRDANSVPAPSITTPASSPFRSNLDSLVITGLCEDGLQLVLGGQAVAGEVTTPAGSLSQICSGGTYTYVINKSSDGTYSFTVKHTLNGSDSATANAQWIRDTAAPTTTITSAPAATHLSTTADFAFSANETGVTFQCRLNDAAYSSCTSPQSLAAMTNGDHTFSVRATDQAGNVGAAATYTWTQAAFLTIGLWHMNESLIDSGSFTQTAGFDNNLTAVGTPSIITSGRYPTSAPRSYQLGNNNYFQVADNPTHHINTNTFTIQGFARFTTLPSGSNFLTLASKSGASPNLGWEVRLIRSGSRYRLQFVASGNGTSQTSRNSSQVNLSTASWYHWAVRFNNGTANFYLSTNATGGIGSGSMGFTNLFMPNAPLRIGAGPSSGTGTSLWFSGYIDEVRWSQPARTISFPSNEFTPD